MTNIQYKITSAQPHVIPHQVGSARCGTRITAFCLLLAICFSFLTYSASAVPQQIGFQGHVEVSGSDFNGTGLFKFVIVDDQDNFLWSNDGQIPTDITGDSGAPVAAVSVNVTDGLYSVTLGKSPMTPVTPAVFATSQTFLRIWFDDGNDAVNNFQQLLPKQEINAVAYAHVAAQVEAGAVNSLGAADGDPPDALVVDGDGRIGVGTLTPAQLLELQSAAPAIRLTDATAGARDVDIFLNQDVLKIIDVENKDLMTFDVLSGNVGVGTASPTNRLFVSDFSANDDQFQNAEIGVEAHHSGIGGAKFNFYRSGAGGQTKSAAEADDELGSIDFYGYGASAYQIGAAIDGNAEAGFTDSSSPAYLAFLTTPVDSVSPTERVRITSTGKVGIGTTTPEEKLDLVADGFGGYISTTSYRDSTFGGGYDLKHARGTADSPIILQDGDKGGIIESYGYDGAAFQEMGGIRFEVDGTPGAGDMPSRIVFRTTPNGSVAPQEVMVIKNTGKVGIGTASPSGKLTVKGGDFYLIETAENNDPDLYIRDVNGKELDLWIDSADGNAHLQTTVAGMNLTLGAGEWEEHIEIRSNGNVGIGTTSPVEKLEVAGNIRVTGGAFIDDGTNLGAPDYVFDDDYPLMPLNELQNFIEREGHLPNVPSAEEIRDNGLNISQFQMRLLEKIEELTLHTLAQQQQIEAQQEQILALQTRLKGM